MNTEIIYRYIGNGGFVVGAPARDLTEADMLDADLRRIVEENMATSGPCWEKVEPAAKKGKAATPTEATTAEAATPTAG